MVVSLDIGKGSHFGYFRAPNGKEENPFEVTNCRDGFHQFWKKLCRFKKAHRLRQVLVGFESTGPYAEPLLHFLRQKPVQLVQINPMHSKRVKELILKVLQETGWRIEGPSGAAVILKLHSSTLRSWIKKLGIRRPA